MCSEGAALLTNLISSAVFGVLALCTVLDVQITVKGIRQGLGVEGNDFWLGTDKPTAKALYLRDGGIALGMLIAALFIPRPANVAFIAGMGAYAGRHVQAYFRWKRLFK